MITLLLIGAVVLALWLFSIDRRGRRLEAEIAALRTALQGAGIAIAETQLSPRSNFRKDFGKDSGKAEEPEEEPAGSAGVPGAEPVAMQSAATPPPLPATAQEVSARRRSAADLEKLVGANWTVILGGIAISLGALFLVRYSIEAGLLGPRARIAAGTLFAAALFAVGEWLRRRDMRLKLPAFESADIPGILTGAGSIAAFGTLYAAHALYGFVGPAVAFVGLTAIGIASLMLSAIHGPKLAAIGMLGAYGAPLLVSSSTPNAPALVGHTLVVTAAIMTVSRLRDWLWLAVGGIIGSTAWAFMTAAIEGAMAGFAGGVLLAGLAIIHIATFGWEKAERPVPLADRPPDRPAVTALALVALSFAMHSASAYDFPTSRQRASGRRFRLPRARRHSSSWRLPSPSTCRWRAIPACSTPPTTARPSCRPTPPPIFWRWGSWPCPSADWPFGPPAAPQQRRRAWPVTSRSRRPSLPS